MRATPTVSRCPWRSRVRAPPPRAAPIRAITLGRPAADSCSSTRKPHSSSTAPSPPAHPPPPPPAPAPRPGRGRPPPPPGPAGGGGGVAGVYGDERLRQRDGVAERER